MGSIRKRTGPRGDRYTARVTDPNGARQSRTFGSPSAAKRWINAMERDFDAGIVVDHRSGDRRFSEYADKWMSERAGLARGTRDRDASYLRARILPEFGHRRVRTITSTDISSWLAGLDLADSTVDKMVQIIAGVLDYARRDRALVTNPAKDLPRRPRNRPARKGRALSDDELARLLAASEQTGQHLIVVAMARLGLRIGEALGLRRSDVSIRDRRLSIERSRDRNGEVRPLKGKRAEDRRVVGLPSDVVEAFQEHLEWMPAAPISGDLFVTGRSTPLVYRNWRRQFWDPTIALSGLEDVKPHDLRRTCVTRLFVVDRWTPPEVKAFVGHSDARVTLEIYAAVMTEDLPIPSDFEARK